MTSNKVPNTTLTNSQVPQLDSTIRTCREKCVVRLRIPIAPLIPLNCMRMLKMTILHGPNNFISVSVIHNQFLV